MTDRQKLFLSVLFDDDVMGDLVKAKKKAGYSNNTLVSEVVEGLQEEILEETRKFLVRKGPAASFKLAQIIANPAENLQAETSLKGIKQLFDAAGLKPKETEKETGPVIVFNLPPKSEEDIEIH